MSWARIAFLFGRIPQGESERVAIELAVTNGRITTGELAVASNLADKTARNVLRGLAANGLRVWEGKNSRDSHRFYRTTGNKQSDRVGYRVDVQVINDVLAGKAAGYQFLLPDFAK